MTGRAVTDNGYQIDVWFGGGQWQARVYAVDAAGNRVDELNTAPHHEYLLNVINYAGVAILDYEAGR